MIQKTKMPPKKEAREARRSSTRAPPTHPEPFHPAVESGKRDSNPRPQPWQGCALPTELFPQSVSRTSEADTPGSPSSYCKPAATAEQSHGHCRGTLPSNRRRGVPHTRLPRHGGEGNRTPDLLNAIQALSQLSYAPSSRSTRKRLSPGTTKYSPGYTECQQIGTGENLIGRYFAAPYVTSLDSVRRACVVLLPRAFSP